MKEFQSVLDIAIPFSPYLLVLLMVSQYFLWRRIKRLNHAKWMVENQYEPAPTEMLIELIDYADTQEKKDRVLQLLQKARIALGHNNIKIGHVVWLGIMGIEDDRHIDEIKIPTFAIEDENK